MHYKKILLSLTVLLASLALAPIAASAEVRPSPATNDTTTTTTETDKTAAAAQRLTIIKSRGAAEIARRLLTLKNLDARINTTVKLSAGDKAALVAEVENTVSGLNTLKAQLDADTTLDAAHTDAQSILNEYRVYALVMPKIHLLITADGQQIIEAKLTTLAGKLQTRLNTAKTSGKDVTSLQAKLDDMTKQTAAAQSISSAVQAAVLPLQPGDFNADHGILAGYQAQLAKAHVDIEAAYNDAQAVYVGLKNL
ncbi:MAG TPA: hypothetical protein VNG90_01385 [Candidatus Acidoferrum sp.]|nr:hypothetical protein [Candidatus Acidoferrum sp.]